MIRSRTGRYAKAPVQLPQWIWVALLAIVIAFYAGSNTGWVLGATESEPEFHSPIPSTLTVITPSVTPEPSATPTPSAAPVVQQQEPELMVEGVEALIRSTFSHDPDIAVAVAKAESGMRCGALNPANTDGSADKGLFQINTVHEARIARHGWSYEDMTDCEKNLTIAKEIQTEQGWTPWSAYNNGSYKQFLNK